VRGVGGSLATDPLRGATWLGVTTNCLQALARYLDSDAVNARTDDDKTLLVAAYR